MQQEAEAGCRVARAGHEACGRAGTQIETLEWSKETK